MTSTPLNGSADDDRSGSSPAPAWPGCPPGFRSFERNPLRGRPAALPSVSFAPIGSFEGGSGELALSIPTAAAGRRLQAPAAAARPAPRPVPPRAARPCSRYPAQPLVRRRQPAVSANSSIRVSAAARRDSNDADESATNPDHPRTAATVKQQRQGVTPTQTRSSAGHRHPPMTRHSRPTAPDDQHGAPGVVMPCCAPIQQSRSPPATGTRGGKIDSNRGHYHYGPVGVKDDD